MSARTGLVALGDSITYGEGGIVLGVDGRSWALWLALTLDLPYSNYAVCGAVVGDVLREQVPRVTRDAEVGVVYAGVNDVRSPGFDPTAFARDLTAVLAAVGSRCDRLLVPTIPLDLGRPRAGTKVAGANTTIRAAAASVGATVVDLDDLAGWRRMLPDAVHPTALGQLEIADRAARALGADVVPSAVFGTSRGRREQLAFARDWARMWLRDAWHREREQRR